ncbi:lysoplasmalogenase [Chitinimonas sp. PSY-7]|uniref:lysoplasmalogenase family protein n=1 Tax=Chitinimonas sp. PSY-7 TaxID=3459088 RepID=UPI0040402447
MQNTFNLPARWLAGIGIAGLLIHLWAQVAGQGSIEFVSKAIPVACMIFWLQGQTGRYAGLIRIGLVFSLCGDMLLEVSPDFFIWGLLAFLCAHLAYVVAFVGASRRLALVWLIPILLWVGTAYVLLYPHLGELAIPVAVYVSVIGAMLWRALALCVKADSSWQWAAALGALFFGISDTILAFNRFHTPWDGANLAVILAYWAGQYGIARSVFRPTVGED